MFFSKAEFREIELPFIYENNPEEIEAGVITIEAYGNVLGEYKYLVASYSVKRKLIDEFDELSNLISDTYNKTVKVRLKIKKDKIKNFKIDLNSLADAYHDDRFKSFELLGWGLNDKSVQSFD